MEQSAEDQGPGRRRAPGRHAALRDTTPAAPQPGDRPEPRTGGRAEARTGHARVSGGPADARTRHALVTGGPAEARTGRGRRGRRRRGRTRTRGLAAGAVALAGGVALLLGLNGAFGGTVAASGAPAGADGATARQDPAAEGGVPANPGRAPASGKGAAEARELPKGQARPSTPAAAGSGTPATTGTADPAAKPDAVQGKPDTVTGQTETGDAQVSLPEADAPGEAKGGDSAGYKADGPSRHTDREAAEYFRARWGRGDKAMKHLKDIRTVGGYLRIYTNLPDSADNSAAAITLCKRGLEYLRANGVQRPIVFVQAEFGENGNPVLANILGPSDHSCRVTYPRPN